MMLTIHPECTNDLQNTATALSANSPESTSETLQNETRDHAKLLNTVLVLFIVAVAAYLFMAPLFG